LTLARGAPRDNLNLARGHYLPKRPATWAGVWVIRYADPDDAPPRAIAVAVLSYPTIASFARDAALGIVDPTAPPTSSRERSQRRPALHLDPHQRLAFLNANVRTISRVVVHPQFRGVGLAARLVRHVCAQCSTRWVEAFALMGRVHPFFENGGMTPIPHPNPAANAPVYYLFDRHATERRPPHPSSTRHPEGA
jgi:GNAT superfamily N-acetyltransferase